jgi:hypothetical protein
MKKVLYVLVLFTAALGFAQNDGSVTNIRTRATDPGTCTPATGVIYVNTATGRFSVCRATNTIDQTPYLGTANTFTANQTFQAGVTIVDGGGGAGVLYLGQGTAQPLGTNSIGLVAPTSVTPYNVFYPSIAATGIPRWSNSSNTVTMTVFDAVLNDVTNDTTTGTTNNSLAKLTSTGAIKAGVSDANIPVFVVASGGSNGAATKAQIAVAGQVPCTMDATASNTEGFYVIESVTVAGQCHAQSGQPTGVFIVGTLVSNSTTSNATSVVQVTGGDFNPSAGSGYSTIQSNGTAQTTRNTVNFISGTNATVACVDNAPSTKTDCTVSASAAAGSRLDQITAATATNTIANAAFQQNFNWALTAAAGIGLNFGETAASTGGTADSQALIEISTAAGSTANPLIVKNSLNGAQTLSALLIAPTWNTTGVVDAALKINVTNTASGAGSLLIDAQISGTSEFKVDKGGVVTAATSMNTSGTSQGMLSLTASTTLPPSFPANTMGWLAPNSATIATPFYFQPASTTGPAASGPMLVAAVTSNISPISYGTNSGNTTTYATTTGTLTSGQLASWDASGNAIASGVVTANTVQNSVSGTTNAIPKFSAAHTITNSALSDNGTIISSSEPIDITNQPVVIEITNNGTTAPVINKFIKLTGAPSTATVSAAAGDNVIGICVGNCTTSGNAQIAVSGQASCVFDNGTVAGDFVQISATGGCHDAGSTYPTSGGDLKGRVLATNASAGTYNIVLFPPEIQAGADGGGYSTIQSNGVGQTPRGTVNFISGTNATVACVDNTTKTDCTVSASSSAGSRLDQITAATFANTLDNADNKQAYRWSLTTSSNVGLLITENVASTAAGTPVLFKVSSIASSSANPVQFDFNGNGLLMDLNGKLAKVGTGSLDTASLSSVSGTGPAVLASNATSVTLDAEATGNTLSRPFYASFTPSCNNATGSQGSFNVPTSGAATFTCFGTTTTQAAADFVDGSTTTTIAGPITLPQGWTGNIDVRLIWFANSATSNALRWSVSVGCVADSAAVSTGPSYNAASASNTAYTGTANQRKTTTLTSLATSGSSTCAAGNSAYFKIDRIGADVGDTLAVTGELLEFQAEGRYTK